jgi:hypothetical protein
VAEGVGIAAMALGDDNRIRLIGLGLTGIGAALRWGQTKIDYAADVRMVSPIPGYIYMGTYRISDLPMRLKAVDANGNILYTKTFTVPRPEAGRPTVVLARVYH